METHVREMNAETNKAGEAKNEQIHKEVRECESIHPPISWKEIDSRKREHSRGTMKMNGNMVSEKITALLNCSGAMSHAI